MSGVGGTRRILLYGSERYVVAILRPIATAARRRGYDVAWYFGGPGAELLESDEVALHSIAQVAAWSSHAVITCNDLVPYFASGVKAQVFHGFDAGKPRHIHVRGLFDLYCTTGPADTASFEALAQRLRYFGVRQTGWPKLDPFFLAHGNDRTEVTRVRPRVLYHSTFSPSWSAAETLYETVSNLSRRGDRDWIVSLHPKMSPDTVAKYRSLEGPNLIFSTVDNILDLFPEVDVMISDTSSALHEFLLTRKPVVTYRNLRPGPYLLDIDAPDRLDDALTAALSRPPELMAAIAAHADAIHPDRDGRSSERVLDAIDAFIRQGGRNERRKPLNWWRKFRIRRRLLRWETTRVARTKSAPSSHR